MGSNLNATPPRSIANTVSTTVMNRAFLCPNSLARTVLVEIHGI